MRRRRQLTIISHGDRAYKNEVSGNSFNVPRNQTIQNINQVALKYLTFCSSQNLIRKNAGFTLQVIYTDSTSGDRTYRYRLPLTVSIPRGDYSQFRNRLTKDEIDKKLNNPEELAKLPTMESLLITNINYAYSVSENQEFKVFSTMHSDENDKDDKNEGLLRIWVGIKKNNAKKLSFSSKQGENHINFSDKRVAKFMGFSQLEAQNNASAKIISFPNIPTEYQSHFKSNESALLFEASYRSNLNFPSCVLAVLGGDVRATGYIMGQENQLNHYAIPVNPTSFQSNFSAPAVNVYDNEDGTKSYQYVDGSRIYDYSSISIDQQPISLFFDTPVSIMSDVPRSFQISDIEFSLYWADTCEPFIIDESHNSEQCPTIASLILE